MKTILAFGDSLTWGFCPFSSKRHDKADRWPDAMVEGLSDVEVITEGLRGRTTAYHSPSFSELRGDIALPIALRSHAPLDLVMIMLGTNDIYSQIPPHKVSRGLRHLVDIIRNMPDPFVHAAPPKIMLISPPTCTAGAMLGVDEDMAAKTRQLAPLVADLAQELGTGFFDAATVAHAEAGDGLHLDAQTSRALGLALQSPVQALLDA